MGKAYTHAQGFNTTSLNGIHGIYIFRDIQGDVIYIGKCDGDFKNRLNSHAYPPHGKLTPHVHFLQVVIANPEKHPLHILEHLSIWYFRPPRNNALWIFAGIKNENSVKKKARDHNLHIRGSIEKFLYSLDSVVIERERTDDLNFKRYGEIESLKSRRVKCSEKGSCLCLKCLVLRRKKERQQD